MKVFDLIQCWVVLLVGCTLAVAMCVSMAISPVFHTFDGYIFGIMFICGCSVPIGVGIRGLLFLREAKVNVNDQTKVFTNENRKDVL